VRSGGKLILSGGWNNALVPAGAVLDYYNRLTAAIGPENARRAVRLYMVPGMIECNGGPGTDTFDMLGVMRRWVERGQAPQDVIASRVEHGKVVRTRPVSVSTGGDLKAGGALMTRRVSSASRVLVGLIGTALTLHASARLGHSTGAQAASSDVAPALRLSTAASSIRRTATITRSRKQRDGVD
jgi:hypothetical protein